MFISDFAIRRPIITVVTMIALVVFGLASLTRLDTDEFPAIDAPIVFLAEPSYFWGLVVGSDVWKELGWNAIIYLAAIAGIDPELYEAATIDGAGRYRKMWNITLPSISGTIAILLILAVAYSLSTNFDQIFVLKNTLNADTSDVVDIYVYRMGLQNGRFSFATAMGLMKSVVSLVLLVAANLVTKRLTGRSLY